MFEYNLWKHIKGFYKDFGFIQGQEAYRYWPPAHIDFINAHISKNQTNSMFEDGIVFLDTDECGRNYYLDCESGLLFYQQNDSYHIARINFSAQHDILDAAYFRKIISIESFRNQSTILSSNIDDIKKIGPCITDNLSDIFLIPILEFTAYSTDELNDIVDEIESILSFTRCRKLWFRGQRQEYLRSRSQETLDKLGLKKAYASFPSLIPSIGRSITNDNLNCIARDMMIWTEAFKIWTLTQSNEFRDIFQIGGHNYNSFIKHIEPFDLVEYIEQFPYDIAEYVYIQDPRELMPATLAMQQYGGLTSMLDITDDLDVAIFFSQSFLNVDTMEYQLCNPDSDNLIYVFAEARNTGTFDFSRRMFANATLDGIETLPSRIANQKCGLLIGANHLAQNTYAFRIVAKIRLKSDEILTTKTVSEMFPSAELDTLYRVYSDVEPRLRGLYG